MQNQCWFHESETGPDLRACTSIKLPSDTDAAVYGPFLRNQTPAICKVPQSQDYTVERPRNEDLWRLGLDIK